ncbi:hypothetical protein [Amycolatopsis xylanica]|uniref:hypothetical protein n=1 Tax=Amycolatopsis xylanica TaxID=589385 RepID=UPI00115FBB6A|nr:hypothetical protein [Amycolatopsis xylanica]
MTILASMKKADASVEWAEILVGLTSDGFLARRGTPRREVLDFVADRLSRERLFEPDMHEPDWLTSQAIDEPAQTAREDARDAREHSGRRATTSMRYSSVIKQVKGCRRTWTIAPLGTTATCSFLSRSHRRSPERVLRPTSCSIPSGQRVIGSSRASRHGFTPHGRTPLTEGESVLLLSLGLGIAR